MDNFYDVNDFFAYVLRKWKSFIGIIIVIALVYGGVRGINLLQEYRNQPKEEENVTEENKDGDEPIWSRVLININIEPVYKEVNGNTIDTTEQIIEAYRKLGSSEKVMNHMYDTWFEKAAKEAEARKTKLHDYGYILDKELKDPYAKADFMSQILLDGVDLGNLSRSVGTDNTSEHIMAIGFKAMDEKLAKEIAADYAKQVTELVKNTVGDYKYQMDDTTVLYEFPSASAGTQSTRYISNVSSGTKITLHYVAVQTVKGVVWGVMIGLLASVILMFFGYMLTRKVYTVSDLKKYGVPVIGLGFMPKKAGKKLWGKLFSMLEGYNWSCSGIDELANEIIRSQHGAEKVIVVAGNGVHSLAAKMVKYLNGTEEEVFVLYNKKEWKAFETETKANIIFVERFGKSLKCELEQEIAFWNEKGMSVTGIVGID